MSKEVHDRIKTETTHLRYICRQPSGEHLNFVPYVLLSGFPLCLSTVYDVYRCGSIPAHYLFLLKLWMKDILEWMQHHLCWPKAPKVCSRRSQGGGKRVPGGKQHLCLDSQGSHWHIWASLQIRRSTSRLHSWASQLVFLYNADVPKTFNSFQMCQKADTCSLVFTLCFTLGSAVQ